jgi:hypothetical protein
MKTIYNKVTKTIFALLQIKTLLQIRDCYEITGSAKAREETSMSTKFM